MRRFLIITVISTLALLPLNAQIQRKFWGYSFGSSKQVVLQGMRAKGYSIDNTSEGFLAIGTTQNPIKFGGYEWEWVSFKFFGNKLYDVSFCVTTDKASSQTIIEHYNSLIRQLDNKYAQYDREIYDDKNAQWGDSNTGVICRYMYIDSNHNIVDYPTRKVNMYLWYYDKNGNKRKWDNDNSEL